MSGWLSKESKERVGMREMLKKYVHQKPEIKWNMISLNEPLWKGDAKGQRNDKRKEMSQTISGVVPK